MFAKSALAVVVLAGSAAAKTCINMTVPVTISARTAVFNITVPQTNLDATTFAQNQTQQGRNFTETVLSGYATTAGTYDISTQFCMPSSMNATMTKPTLQILTHGIGFDKTYWDLSYDNFNYSYIDVATDVYKYCTLSYDRLGVGNSSHGEPLDEIQASLEMAALFELTMMLRNATFPGIKQTFGKVTHVGHSFGSAQTYALVNMYPTISDGIVLTGFSMNASFVGYFEAGSNFEQAYLNQPFRLGNVSSSAVESVLNTNISSSTVESVLNMYSLTDYVVGLKSSSPSLDYPAGYLTNANIGANQYLFFLPGFFDPGLLLVAENTKQPVTIGELLTLGSPPMMNAFAGPVLIITGSNDLPYCGGNCFATGNASLPSIPAAAAMNFPMVPSGDFTAYIQPNSGHGINLHYNATGAYDVIQTFLQSKGL